MQSTFTDRSMIALLEDAVERHADLPALHTPGVHTSGAHASGLHASGQGDADPRTFSHRELWREIALFASGLCKLGVRRGENVLLWSESRDRWLITDLALQALGAPSVPRGTEAPPGEVEFIVDKVKARVAVVENPRCLARLPARGHALEIVILLDGSAPAQGLSFAVYRFDEVQALADLAHAEAQLHEAIAERRADETATIVFTSGTTGQPKGVVLTSANLASNLLQAVDAISYLPRAAKCLSILPPWHTFERMVEYAMLHLGLCIVYSSRRTFAQDLHTIAPHVLAAVPRLWMMLMDGVLAKIAEMKAPRRRVLNGALRLAAAHQASMQRRSGLGFAQAEINAENSTLKRRICDFAWFAATPLVWAVRRTLLARIRTALGVQNLGPEGAAISGGGSLPEHVERFFAALGAPLLNGYGLTETSPVLSLKVHARPVAGSVGQPLAQTEIRIVDPETGATLPADRQGVIFARGPQVMKGYYDEPQATAQVLSAQGWFNTGDLGRQSSAGDLQITGRAKDTIVLLSGENIEPEPLENALTSTGLIKQAVVVGQDQKQLGALIVLDDEALKRRGIAVRAIDSSELLAQIRAEIDRKVSPRNGFRSHERIARFTLLQAPLSVEDGSLSATLKVKRGIVHDRHAALIRSMFEESRRET